MLRGTLKIYPLKSTKAQSEIFQSFRTFGGSSSRQQQVIYNEKDDYRKTIAPWLKFGEYQKGLLSHLSTPEILRALFVLQICSVDLIVDKSTQVSNLTIFIKKLKN